MFDSPLFKNFIDRRTAIGRETAGGDLADARLVAFVNYACGVALGRDESDRSRPVRRI